MKNIFEETYLKIIAEANDNSTINRPLLIKCLIKWQNRISGDSRFIGNDYKKSEDVDKYLYDIWNGSSETLNNFATTLNINSETTEQDIMKAIGNNLKEKFEIKLPYV